MSNRHLTKWWIGEKCKRCRLLIEKHHVVEYFGVSSAAHMPWDCITLLISNKKLDIRYIDKDMWKAMDNLFEQLIKFENKDNSIDQT